MSNLTMLRAYAQKSPESFPSSILFRTSSKNITIFDAYPKSMFHFLILPRVQEPKLNATRLDNLRSLLSGDKATAKEVLYGLADDAKEVKKEIEKEMIQRYGFKWEVWMGFHGAPSMAHLHLHVLSGDLCSDKLKHKKHYNSFHPDLDFFLRLDDVLSWLDADPFFFSSKVNGLKPSTYEHILKEPLVCFSCNAEMKNIPILKAHLLEEWEILEKRAKPTSKVKKRKAPDATDHDGGALAEPEGNREETDEALPSSEK